MDKSKNFHNVHKFAFPYQISTTAKSTATSTLTTSIKATGTWMPCDGVVERVVNVDVDTSQTPTYKIFIRYSPHHYYELRNMSSVTTDDYVEYTIAATGTLKTLQRFDASAVDDLQRPARSYQVRFSIPTTTITATAPGSATVTATAKGTANIIVEGWS